MKNLHICFSNFKYCLPTIAPPPPSPNTHHLRHRRRRPLPSSSSSILVKNFNSLYDLSDVVVHHTTNSLFSSDVDNNIIISTATTTNSSSDDPDFSAVLASKRLFVSSPGESNSIVDSLPNSPITTKLSAGGGGGGGGNNVIAGGGVAIQTYSPDPYADFRRSMQEMLEAHRSECDDESDLDYLGELLKCYLSLNPKRNHKLIVRAFSDLVVSLLQ